MRNQALVLFQEAPEDSKPWLVCRFSNGPLYDGARGYSKVLVDLMWFGTEAEARAHAHSIDHGSNR